MRVSIGNKLVLGFAFAVVLLLGVSLLYYRTTTELIATENWVAHTHDVIASLESGLAILTDAETQQRGYLLTGDDRFLKDSQEAQRRMNAWFADIRELTADNPQQTARLAQLEPLIVQRLAMLNDRIRLRQAQGLQAAAMAVSSHEGKDLMDSIWRMALEMRAAENGLLRQRTATVQRQARMNLAIIVTGGVLTFTAGLLALGVLRRDLRKREQAEEQLRQSEERTRLILENIRDYAIVMLDPEGRIVSWNAGAERIKGYGAAEIVGQNFSLFYPAEARQGGIPQQKLAEAATRGRVENEGWRVRKDGSQFWADVVITAVRGRAGGLLGFVKVTRDMTERRRVEQELSESRALMGSILDNTPTVVFLKDLAGRYLFVNRRFAELAGKPRERILGRNGFELFRPELAEAARAHDLKVIETGQAAEFEETIMHPDGPHTYLAVKFPVRDAAGKIYATAGVSQDNTERKRMEEELDRFFSLSLDFLCIASADGFFKRVSPAVTDILGWSIAEFLARPFIEFVHPDDHAATRREVEKQVVAGERVLHFENRYRHKDGSWRVLSWRSIPQPGGLMYATARDVTEQKLAADKIARLNADLAQRATQLETLNKELEAFSYSVSHDLRAPLRHMDGFVSLLKKHTQESLDEKSRRFLDIIADAARKMGQLVDDLLSFSRMARTEMRQGRVNLAELVAEIKDELRPELDGRAVEWKTGALPEVQGDRAMLRLALTNLLQNAVKYTRPRQPAVIEIGVQAGPETVIFVRDNGVGFDMQYVHKLFGVFQRLHTEDEFEGTGIGLAIVRRIVSRHGGRTWAEGKPDEGATVYFTLPPLSNPQPQLET